MAFSFAEWLRKEGLDKFCCFFHRVLAPAYSDDICIVVFTGKLGGVQVPRQCSTDSLDFVSGNLFTISLSTQNDAQRVHAGTLIFDDR